MRVSHKCHTNEIISDRCMTYEFIYIFCSQYQYHAESGSGKASKTTHAEKLGC